MIDIILLEPEHEGNVGAACRVMANFGFESLVIVNPKCDLDSSDLHKRAKHSEHIVRSIRVAKTIPKYDMIAGTTSKVFNDYNVARSPLSPKELAKKIDAAGKSADIGILFGREGIGLTNEEISKCDMVVSIDTSKTYPALNLSHAVAIILYELFKIDTDLAVKNINIPLALEIDKKQIDKMMNSIIKKCGFSTKEKSELQKTIWKNVFSKAILTRREAFGVMGLLNKLEKRLGKAFKR